MSDDERARDRYQDRGGNRGPRESRGGDRERGGTPSDRRQRSRSPRRERGGRRNNRYRSRSRDRDGANDHRGRGRSDRDYDRDERDDRSRRDPPRGPRGGAAPPSGPRRSDFSSRSSGPVKPPTGPRGHTEAARKEEVPDVEMKESAQKPVDMDDETWEMKKMMGFTGFRSTKNVKVPGNDKNYGVRRDKKLEARQYMNRQGGFNRPLSPSRT